MTQWQDQLTNGTRLSGRIAEAFGHRVESGRQKFSQRVHAAWLECTAECPLNLASPLELWKQWLDYCVDFTQRSVLFWDTLRQRGNNFVEHERAGKPPVLHFAYDTVLDARAFERPVNYALLRITPPEGVVVDARRRPYVVIDPRAGHGPGIGGFKDDSQVGVALRAGHPVYFVIFYPEPEPGQTLLDVCAAEARFIRKVRELHPDSPRPAIVGNCQGGWAAMMLAAANPDDTGPIVINGAPMSYWGGAWSDGEGNNPMRYAGGLLGGSWLASFAADLGSGKFDGAHLVANFENLNPANTFWDKYYHLFANIDKEPPRFLEFERWWGGFYLMNREEIEWIVRNLFVGNRLWSGTEPAQAGRFFDLRAIKAPIVLFASMGDNITPPQQAFNWVADVYGSTEEIKARGQTIVGLVHEDIGHLGIFVSGRVAKKEHAQIVSVLKSIEHLPPGLWAMRIHERQGPDGGVDYDVDFTERCLEEVAARLNRFERRDEHAFEAAAGVSELNQSLYDLFARPLVRALSNDFLAEAGRRFHPLRFTRWAFSDLNAAAWWLEPAAAAVAESRQALGPDQPLRRLERLVSEMISASFDLHRDLRDACSEAAFFQSYGSLFLISPAESGRCGGGFEKQAADPRTRPAVQEALQAIDKGGYAEAVARAAVMLQSQDQPLPVWRLHLRRELAEEYRDLLPDLPQDAWRKIRGEQEIITRFEPERALAALPALLSRSEDRQRFLTLLERLLADERVHPEQATPAQRAALARIQEVLGSGAKVRARTPSRRAVR
jgi:pimeloyl-ACP methyl ester carboxylesterase